jgi:hypothetical protein
MGIQTFQVVFPPEAGSAVTNARMLRRLLGQEIREYEIDVREVELYDGKIVAREVAEWKRKQSQNVERDLRGASPRNGQRSCSAPPHPPEKS